MSNNDKLIKRQYELEDEALGIGLDRARRMLTGERTEKNVEIFGGDITDGSHQRKRSLIYKIAVEDLPRLADAIKWERENCGTKTAGLYVALEQCGRDEEVASVIIKTLFGAFCGSRSSNADEDEDVDDTDADIGVSMLSIAEDVGEACWLLYKGKREKTKPSVGNFRKIKKPVDKVKAVFDCREERVRLGLNLTRIYLCMTEYYNEINPGPGKPMAVEMTDSTIDSIMEDVSSDEGIDSSIAQDSDIPEHLLEKNLVSPCWRPMLVPPKSWKSMKDGGYRGRLAGKVSLIKTRGKLSRFSLDSCPAVLEAVNHLQNTPFRINQYVFSVFSSLFGDFTTILQQHLPLLDPRKNHHFEKLLDVPEKSLEFGLSKKIRHLWTANWTLIREAKVFKSDAFYFFTSCDFRGRIYPKSSYLNYQSGDLSRSLLEFDVGKILQDKNAENWLAIHGANCYAEEIAGISIDKSSFDRRLSWVRENEDKVIALGNLESLFWGMPVELEEWWLKADKPWAFLAWAREWCMYKSNPHEHESHLPVDVDGSANGYQHIAALLGSRRLAEWVNMLPCEYPNDIYTHVTNVASDELNKNQSHDSNIATLYNQYLDPDDTDSCEHSKSYAARQMLNLSLCDKLSRKVAKKIIMPYAYSATIPTMAKTLLSESDLFKKWNEGQINPNYSEEIRKGIRPPFLASKVLLLVAKELAIVICESIVTLFPEVKELLDWFVRTGTQLAQKGVFPHWISASGFCIEQYYAEEEDIRIHALGKKYVYKKKLHKPAMIKHGNALGANFIHSCDAAHMMLTVNQAQKEGISSFRMIHDSFATHAADMGKLYHILRDEFVLMYRDENRLGNLLMDLEKQWPDIQSAVGELPNVNDLEISCVKDAKYFFA